MELEESTYLTSGSTTKSQLSRQYGTGTKTEIYAVLSWPGQSQIGTTSRGGKINSISQ